MAKYFGVKFSTKYTPNIITDEHYFNESLKIFKGTTANKIVIDKDSYSIFRPLVGDIITFENEEEGGGVGEINEIKAGDIEFMDKTWLFVKENNEVIKIIQRNNLPFITPKQEKE